MDDTDRRLVMLLAVNPRVHVREMARRLGISRQAVHHRMRALTEAGVLRGTTAAISIEYLGAVPVVVFGRSGTASIEETLARLGQSEFTRRVVVGGGNYLYVVGWLRDIAELDGYADFVREAADMREPTVGIYSMDPRLMPEYTVDGIGRRRQSNRELSPLDLRIIATLADDARRPTGEIAAAVGVSTKTVRRRLEAMLSEGLLELHVRTDSPSGGDLFTLVQIRLRDGADRVAVARRLLSKSPVRDGYVRAFSNLPQLLVMVFWTEHMTEVREIVRGIGGDEDVVGVVPNVGLFERIYPTWRERALPTPLPLPRKGRRRGPGSTSSVG